DHAQGETPGYPRMLARAAWRDHDERHEQHTLDTRKEPERPDRDPVRQREVKGDRRRDRDLRRPERIAALEPPRQHPRLALDAPGHCLRKLLHAPDGARALRTAVHDGRGTR